MEDSIERILEQEIGKLGAIGGGEAGRHGAQFAARHLPNDVFEATVELDVGADQATHMFGAGISAVGEDIDGDPGRANPVLRAIVPAGMMDLNPAVVEVEIVPVDPAHSRVILTGTAKEGLIKQHAGEKAVRRVLEAVGLGQAPSIELGES